jgi:hypothetical protein
MVAELVYGPRDISRQVVYVAGDTVTYGQVADLVEARFGGSWTRELWDLDFLRMRLQVSREYLSPCILSYCEEWGVVVLS